ncbi:MAG: RNA polymerase factor sigma-54 [Eubacteriales bacterium]|jgi:RNA polymerase sigma-54 factor|nr:RNA polymerase factor sigma-54 [Eubacteriales bacterium]
MDLYLGHDLKTEQTQQLALTPEMVQSLKILKFSGEELLDYIFDELDKNPVLDINEEDMKDRQMVAASSAQMSAESDAKEHLDEKYGSNSESGGWESYEWYDYDDYFDGGTAGDFADFSYDSKYRDRNEFDADSESLQEHLGVQLELTDAPYIVKATADYIIQTLDENGYMTLTVSEIADELCIDEETVKKALELVWSFEPAGVGAADLVECLVLQLKAIERYDDIYQKILDYHMEDMARNRLQTIAKSTGIKIGEAEQRVEILRSLEPKPGRGYSSYENIKYIIPDVKVKKIEGVYNIFVNRAASPRLIVRDEYIEMLSNAEDSDVGTFLSDQIGSAKWLIKALRQRDDTIMKVTGEIVRRQKRFFDEGRRALVPLTMKEVAAEVGVHESTVSRAVNGKYLLCGQGVFELRYFFTGASSFGNGDTTAESVKLLISDLVKSEDRTRPLSDRSIAEAIFITGVRISRRTVAKYREELGIPASSVRKKRVR